MTEQETEQIAATIAERLHKSVLQIPAEMAEYLKEWKGWLGYTDICGGPWPYRLNTCITADGGIQLLLLTADGDRILERTLHP